MNAKGAISDFLDSKGYKYTLNSEELDLFDIILDASPMWLNVDVKWVMQNIVKNKNYKQPKNTTELKAWLKKELKKHYQYLSKPPKTLQDLSWPHSEHGPLMFLGQFDLTQYFHDKTYLFIFLDIQSNQCVHIIQST